MYKIAVMGDYDSIYGFMSLGLSVFPVNTREEGRKQLLELAQEDYGIVYITEALAAQLTEEIADFKDRATPALVLIPGISGNTGRGMALIKELVEQAVGADIL